MNVIFISGISTRALRVPRAAHCKICKYVFARDGHWIPEHKRSASIYATGTREQRTVYRRVSRTSRECVCSFHGSRRRGECREAATKRIRCRRRIQPRQLSAIGVSAHAADLCLPRDPGAIKSDISSGAVYRDSAKSAQRAATGSPDKNRALSLRGLHPPIVFQDRPPWIPRCLHLLFSLVLINDAKRYWEIKVDISWKIIYRS